MAAGAAPEVPVLAYLVVGLLAMLSWVVARGALYSWNHTFGWLFARLASALDIKVLGQHIGAGGILRSLNLTIVKRLGQWASGSEHAMGYFFHGAARLQEWATHEIAATARDTLHFGEWLVHGHLPKVAKYAGLAALPPALLTRLIYGAVRHELAADYGLIRHVLPHQLGTLVTALVRPLWRRLTHLEHLLGAKSAAALAAATGAITVTLPNVHIFPRLKALERWDGFTKRRIRRLEKLLGAAGIAAVMANALGLPNWRCITRGNLGRTSRALCGLGPRALEDLLGLLADVLILTNICAVITILEDGLGLIETPLNDLIGGVEAMACYGDNEHPPTLTLPPLSLPAVVGFNQLYLP